MDLKQPLLESPKLESIIKHSKGTNMKSTSFDWIFFKRLLFLFKIIMKPWYCILLTILLCGSSVGQIYLVSYTGRVIGSFYQSIFEQNQNNFVSVLWFAAIVIFGSAILESINKLFVELLSWNWRKTLVHQLHQVYFSDNLFYKITNFDQRIDNPDQRITTDIDNFTLSLGDIFYNSITAPILIILYTYLTITKVIWFAPLLIAGYFFLGYILNKTVMSRIVRLVFVQEKLEGDFRFSHVRVRTSAESIALYNGGEREQAYVNSIFADLLQNKLKIVKMHFVLNGITNTFAYMGSIINYVVVGIPILFLNANQAPTPQYISESSFVCIMLVQGFTQFINISQSLSDVGGYTARVVQIFEVLEEIKNTPYDKPQDHPGKVIEFDKVTCFTPEGQKLTENLDFKIESGSNLLIMGPTGSGKSTILRTLNGLWPFYQGRITKPKLGDDSSILSIFYLPQVPYLFYGSLVDQIIYPDTFTTLSELEIKALLTKVFLNRLFEWSDSEEENKQINLFAKTTKKHWASILSPGQQQLLSFARLIYHKPIFGVLDEATSSLPEDLEEKLYNLCREMEITLVSIGHRSSLLPYHHKLLKLDSQHNWELSQISEQQERK